MNVGQQESAEEWLSQIVFLDIVMWDAPEVGRGRLGKDKVSVPYLTKQRTRVGLLYGDCGGGYRWSRGGGLEDSGSG